MVNFMNDKVIVISDLHLGCGDDFDIFAGPRKADEFLAFTRSAAKPGEPVELVINGDFVDFLQLRPWNQAVDRDEARTKIARIVAAHEDGVFRALGEFLAASENRLTVLLGNHDIELAFPEVWASVRDAILRHAGAGAGLRLTFTFDNGGRVTYLRRVGGVPIHIEHGNIGDRYNDMNYNLLLQDSERETRNFSFPPGTRLVYGIMNRHKESYRFVDLLKPEIPAVPFLLLALNPRAAVDIPGVAGNLLSAVGNGFVGWLRSKIAGPTFGPPAAFDSAATIEQVADGMQRELAAAYLLENHQASVTSADALLLNQYFESDGFAPAAAGPVMGPNLQKIQERLARAAIAALGRPVDLSDSVYYWSDHPEREDVKCAERRLAGNVKAVVFGHTHRPLKNEFDGGKIYVNSGAWANQITLPVAGESVLDWLARLGLNDQMNCASFPTYVTFTATGAGTAVSLNLWNRQEQERWRKDITA